MDNILHFYKTFSALILCSTFWMHYAKWFWGSVLKIVNFFLLCSHYLLLKKVVVLRIKKLNSFHPKFNGPAVLEKRSKLITVYRQTNDGQLVIRKAYLSFHLS